MKEHDHKGVVQLYEKTCQVFFSRYLWRIRLLYWRHRDGTNERVLFIPSTCNGGFIEYCDYMYIGWKDGVGMYIKLSLPQILIKASYLLE
jgi:hypothetical protein